MIDITQSQREMTFDQLESIVKDELKHPYYDVVNNRAKVMNTWYQAEHDEYLYTNNILFSDKAYIIKQSSVESDLDYQRKLDRMKLFPLEQKFLSAQQRIYDENNVNREYSGDKDFWDWKEQNFDDASESVTEFYRDKVLYVKEVLGFGAIVTDIMVDADRNTLRSADNNVVPYNVVLRPHEIFNFGYEQGVLTYFVTRQMHFNHLNEKMYRWIAYTPKNIYMWQQTSGANKEFVAGIPNPFGEVPVTILKGQTDANSGFMVGKPRRYSLKGLYLSASELFYDLKQGAELFAHPIPVMHESIMKSMAGVADSEQYDSAKVVEKVGMSIVIPDDMQVPSTMLYQADMQGLQYLREVIFNDLMGLIFLLAQVRDKSVVKSNVSGSAKRLDNVEEQGLLATTAMDMEVIENEVLRRMAKVRGEDPAKFSVTYSKHYDLSSADEIWQDIAEGMQYKGMPVGTLKYLMHEYLRKRSAPQEWIEKIMSELDAYGMPKTPQDLKDLVDILPPEELERQAKIGIESFNNEPIN